MFTNYFTQARPLLILNRVKQEIIPSQILIFATAYRAKISDISNHQPSK